MEDEPYQRKRRFTRTRIPGHGLEVHEVDGGFDAPYGKRDARFWWIVVAVLVVVPALFAIGALLGR